MKRQHLAKLAMYLETVPEEYFDMSEWVKGAIVFNGLFKVSPDCGTTACAGGWACMIPEFREEGLYLSNYVGSSCPTYKGLTGTDALAAFFCIGYPDARQIFNGNYRAKPIEIASLIYALLAR
jgi:hypothetical protein